MNTVSASSLSYEPASRLLVGKSGVSVKLSKATASLLEALLQAGPDGISRRDLHQAVWGHNHASDDALNHLVSRLRHKIKTCDPKELWRVETIPQFGYRLCQCGEPHIAARWGQRLFQWLTSRFD